MAKQWAAHDACQHPATPVMRNKCRRVSRAVRDTLSGSTDAVLETLVGQPVVGWRTWDDETEGPRLFRYEGTLERSYRHRDGFTVWIVVSEQRPQGTGHPASFVHVV